MPTSTDSSLLLLALAALVAFLSAQVFMGWIRVSQHHAGWRRWGALGVAALVFGSGFTIAVAIGLLGEALAFPVGFRTVWVVGLWTGAMLIALPVAAWPSHKPGIVASTGAGVLLASVVVAVQLGLLSAIGFRPGLRIRNEFVAMGWLVMAVGFGAAISLGLPSPSQKNRRESWRYAGAAVMGIGALAGQALLVSGTNIPTQVGSVYRNELSASVFALIGGALLPMILAILMVDLELRRRQWRSERRRRRRDARRASALDSRSGRAASSMAVVAPATLVPGLAANAPETPPAATPSEAPPATPATAVDRCDPESPIASDAGPISTVRA